MLFVLFLARAAHHPFALRPVAARDQGQSAARRRDRHSASIAAWSAIYTLGAAYAGVAGGLLAQTTAFVSLDVLEFHRSADVMLIADHRRHRLALWRPHRRASLFKLLQDYLPISRRNTGSSGSASCWW